MKTIVCLKKFDDKGLNEQLHPKELLLSKISLQI